MKWFRHLRKLAAALAACTVVVACSSSSGSKSASGGTSPTTVVSAGASTSTTASGGTPDPNGVLKYGVDLTNEFSDNFDPGMEANDCSYIETSLIFDSLTHSKGENTVDGGVAQSWDVDPAGTTITMHLRAGNVFSDGTPVDSAAVKTSILHTQKSPLRTSLGEIKSIDTPDPLTVILHLSGPTAGDLLWSVGYVDGQIQAPASIPTAATHPVGAGPFVLAKYTTGQLISLRANPKYRDSSTYKLGGVDFVQVGTGPQAVGALKSGQVDMIDLQPADYQTLKSDPNFGISSTPSSQYQMLQLRLDQPPFNNQQVRAALEYAVDKQELNRVAFNGTAEIATQPFPSFSAGHDRTLDGQYGYDPAKAKAMLAAAGFPNGVSFDMVIPAGVSTFERMAPLMQNELAAAGFKVKIIPVAGGEYLATVYEHKTGNAVLTLNLTNGPAIWSNFGSNYTKAGFVAHAFGSVRPEIEALVNKAQMTLDPAQIGPPMQQASGLIMSEGLEVPLIFQSAQVAYNKARVGGPPVAPIGTCRSNLEGVFIKK